MLTRVLVALFGAFFLVMAAVEMSEGRFGLAAIQVGTALFFFLTLYLDVRRAKSAASSPAAAPPGLTRKPASIVTPIVIAVFAITIDAILGAALLSGIAAFFSATAGLLWTLAAFRDRRVMLTRLRAVAIVLVPAAAAVGYGMHDDRLARERITATAEALRVYKSKHGGYPDRLDALVPEYFPELPKARTWGEGRRIRYLRGKDGSVELMYVSIPPFGRSALDVDSGKWTFYD